MSLSCVEGEEYGEPEECRGEEGRDEGSLCIRESFLDFKVELLSAHSLHKSEV